MSQTPSAGQLSRVVSQTLEEAAFVFAEAAAEPVQQRGDVVEGVLSFSGVQSGSIVMLTSPAFAAELAANLLGVDPDDAEALVRGKDAVGEMLNIIGGVLLEAWLGSHEACMLEAPRVAERAAAEALEHHRAAAAAAVALLADEEHPILAALHVEAA